MNPRVTEILKEAGLIDGRWFTEHGRNRGTAVHIATTYIDQGKLDYGTVSTAIEKYVEAYEAFIRDVEPVVEESELEVQHSTLGYAGRLDRIMSWNGHRAVVDLKCGGSAAWHGVQLAAYAACWSKQYSPEKGMLKRFNLYLLPSGKYRLEERKDRNDWAVFQAALTLYNWRKSHE